MDTENYDPLSKLETSPTTASSDATHTPTTTRSRWLRHLPVITHLALWLLMTAYFIAALALHPEKGALVLSLLYAFVTLKLLFAYTGTHWATRPIAKVWAVLVHPVEKIPARWRGWVGLSVPVIGIVLITVLLPATATGSRGQRLISLLGLATFILILYITSNNRRAVKWRIVVVGVTLQFLLGLFILKTSVGYNMFHWISELASSFLEFSKRGAEFVFGPDITQLKIFAVSVLPGVLFFASFIQMAYYWGAMQWIVKKVAWLMVRLMDTSGSESVVAAASPFVGQGESALLVKPFIEDMTLSELHATMCSGFSTIAGSVLIAFISFGIDSQALITACVMSTPCSLAVSKLRYPETEPSTTKGDVQIPQEEDRESNFLHAAANGAAQGVHLCLLIAGTLLAVISLLALVNALLTWFGAFLGFQALTLTMIARWLFVPFAWLIGIPSQDVIAVAELMATKMFVNEFAAFDQLKNLKSVLSLRGQYLATFSLCGFANFASIGIQIGCIGAMAPSRKGDLAKVALSAMLCGTVSTFMTATISGILY